MNGLRRVCGSKTKFRTNYVESRIHEMVEAIKVTVRVLDTPSSSTGIAEVILHCSELLQQKGLAHRQLAYSLSTFKAVTLLVFVAVFDHEGASRVVVVIGEGRTVWME